MKYETNQHVLRYLHAAVDSLSNSSFLCVISQGAEWVFRNTEDMHLSHRVVEVSHAPYNTLFAANNGRYAIAVPDVLEAPDVPVLRDNVVHEWVMVRVPMYCLAPLIGRVHDLIPGHIAMSASGSITRVFVSIPKLAGWSPSGHPVFWLSGVADSEKVWADSIVGPAVLEVPAPDGRDIDTQELVVFDYGQPVPECIPEWPVVGGINGPYVYPWEDAERGMHSLAACMCRVESSDEMFPAIAAKLRTFEQEGTAVDINGEAYEVPPGSNMIALFRGPLVQWKS